MLLLVVETCLRLLHPIIPFVTEELCHHLPAPVRASTAASLSLAPYPVPSGGQSPAKNSWQGLHTNPQSLQATAEFALVLAVMDAYRGLYEQHKCKPWTAAVASTPTPTPTAVTVAATPAMIDRVVLWCTTAAVHQRLSALKTSLAAMMKLPTPNHIDVQMQNDDHATPSPAPEFIVVDVKPTVVSAVDESVRMAVRVLPARAL